MQQRNGYAMMNFAKAFWLEHAVSDDRTKAEIIGSNNSISFEMPDGLDIARFQSRNTDGSIELEIEFSVDSNYAPTGILKVGGSLGRLIWERQTGADRIERTMEAMRLCISDAMMTSQKRPAP